MKFFARLKQENLAIATITHTSTPGACARSKACFLLPESYRMKQKERAITVQYCTTDILCTILRIKVTLMCLNLYCTQNITLRSLHVYAFVLVRLVRKYSLIEFRITSTISSNLYIVP